MLWGAPGQGGVVRFLVPQHRPILNIFFNWKKAPVLPRHLDIFKAFTIIKIQQKLKISKDFIYTTGPETGGGTGEGGRGDTIVRTLECVYVLYI